MSDDDTVPGDDMTDAQGEDVDEDINAEQLGSGGGGSSSGALQSKRKPHGRNKRRWAKDGPEPMAFNRHGGAVSHPRYSALNRYIAEVGRDLPLDIHDWRLMPTDQLKFAWERIEVVQNTYNSREMGRNVFCGHQQGIKLKVREKTEKKLCAAWKSYKTNLRSNDYKPDINDPTRFTPPYEGIEPEEWRSLVTLWETPHYQQIQQTNRLNRQQLDINHTAGTMPFEVIGEEFRERMQSSPDRATMYSLTHTENQDCQTWNEGSLLFWQEYQAELAKQSQERQDTQEGRNAAFKVVFGKRDGKGRVFGAGCGIRPGDIPGTSSSIQHGRRYAQEGRVRELEAQNNQRQREFEARCQQMDETRQQMELQRKQLEAQ